MQTVGNNIMELSSEAALVVVLAHSLVLFIFSSQSLQEAMISIERVLRREHDIGPGEENNFRINKIKK